MCGQENVLKLILKNVSKIVLKEMIQQVDEHGGSAIYYACSGRHLDCIKLLVEQFGANVNSPLHSGYTPLMAAANIQFEQKGMFDNGTADSVNDIADDPVVKYLIDQGADVNTIVPEFNWTVLNSCLRWNPSVNVAKSLLDVSDFDVHYIDPIGRSYLAAAVDKYFDANHEKNLVHSSCLSKNHNLLLICKMLLERGVDPNIYFGRYRSPINSVRKNWKDENGTKLIQLLLKHGAVENSVLKERADKVVDQRVANGEKRLDIAFENTRVILENASGLKVHAKSILALINEKSIVNQFVSRMVYVEPSSFTSIHDGSYISTGGAR